MVSVPRMVSVKIYSPAHKPEWDTFVLESARQGTFMHLRDYMEYHANRFEDFSLMAYSGTRLVAVLPANRRGNILQSHGGLTYGGWLTSCRHVDADLMLSVFDAANSILRSHGFEKVQYKPVPWIYNAVPGDDDIYSLFRLHASKTACGVSEAINMNRPQSFNENSRRNLKKARNAGFKVVRRGNFSPFWDVLTATLLDRHGVAPVHSLDEIQYLHEKFPANIQLVEVVDEAARTVAGTVLFLSRSVAHAQYIASTPRGRDNGALALLFHEVIDSCRGKYDYFDFGISTEDGGNILNAGLMRQKSGFGGRAVCYDTYEYNL